MSDQQPAEQPVPDGSEPTPGPDRHAVTGAATPSSAPAPSGPLSPVAPAPAPTRRSRSTALPWVLVALLSAAVLVLGTLLFTREGELAALRATPPATFTVPAEPSASASSETPDPEVIALMKSLPRRKASDPTARGKVDAPVVMIVWSDYRCPFCAKWATTTLKDLQPYVDSGSLRIESRDLVLFGEESQLAAVAARAAGNQGKYWEFHDAVFAAAPASGHPTIKKADVLAFAKTAGVPDLAKFSKDLSSNSLDAAVTADTNEARQLGISGTPFFLINTTPINGAQPTEAFVQAIEASGGHR